MKNLEASLEVFLLSALWGLGESAEEQAEYWCEGEEALFIRGKFWMCVVSSLAVKK